MFVPQQYLAWAGAYYGRARYDLASSGFPDQPQDWLTEPLLANDYGATGRLVQHLGELYNLPSSEITLTLGTSQALFAALAALVEPGARVLVEKPSYEPLWAIPQALGAEVVFFERFEPLDDLPAAKVLVVTNPHNPTGAVWSDAQLTELAEKCQRQGTVLLIDEVYRDFQDLTPTTTRKLHPNIVAVSSLTKVYGLGWARVGWLFAPAELTQRAWGILKYLSGNNPPLCAALGLQALAKREAFWQQSHQRATENLKIVGAWLSQQPHLRWQAPPYGLFGFVWHRSGEDLRPRIEAGCREQEVLVVPGSFFGDPRGFRLAWSQPADQVRAGLDQLTQVMRA